MLLSIFKSVNTVLCQRSHASTAPGGHIKLNRSLFRSLLWQKKNIWCVYRVQNPLFTNYESSSALKRLDSVCFFCFSYCHAKSQSGLSGNLIPAFWACGVKGIYLHHAVASHWPDWFHLFSPDRQMYAQACKHKSLSLHLSFLLWLVCLSVRAQIYIL